MKYIINNSKDITNAIYGLEKLVDGMDTSIRRLKTAKASISQPTDNQLLVWDEDLSMVVNSPWQLPAADGAANEILHTDGAGNLVWVAPGAIAVAGADTQVQYNAGGVMAAEAAFTYNYGTNTLTADHYRATGDFSPSAADGATLGTAALEFSDAYFADEAVLYFGNDQEVTLTHVPDTGLQLNTTMQMQFRDANLYIASLNDGHLDLEADTQIDLNSAVYLDVCADAGADVNKFLVRDAGGIIDYRTGAELLSDLSGDATGAFDWNAQALTNISTVTAGGVITPKIYPSANSTTAIQILQADGVTPILNVDTTNKRIGINNIAPTVELDIVGDINIDASSYYQYGGVDAFKLMKKGYHASYFDAVIIGHEAGDTTTDGSTELQTVVGFRSGKENTGVRLTGFGYLTGYQNDGDYVSVMGSGAGRENTGEGLMGFGYYAGYGNSGTQVAGIGWQAAKDNSGDDTFCMGRESGSGNSGDDCVFIGYMSGKDNVTSSQFIVKQANINATPLIQGNFNSGNVGIGVVTPTAKLHLPASQAGAGLASAKIVPGVVATVPVSGNIESDGTHLYWTDSGGTRRQLDN